MHHSAIRLNVQKNWLSMQRNGAWWSRVSRNCMQSSQGVIRAITAACVVICPLGVAASASVQIGVFQTEGGDRYQAHSEWQWALRGGGAQVIGFDSMSQAPPRSPLIIVDDVPLSEEDAAVLARWVADGGVLLIAGIQPLYLEFGRDEDQEAKHVLNETLVRLAGVVPDYHDPGLIGTYPLIVQSDPLLSPFQAGDGLRLGKRGVAHALRLRATDAEVLAESAHIRPGRGSMVYRKAAPTITVRRSGLGSILFTRFSPAAVAACYPDMDDRATDCSAAGTARGLMRMLVANLLWQELGIQIPLPWETPGSSVTGVLITGDVHADDHDIQIRSARQMAKVTEPFGVPVTFFIVGDVANRARAHFDALTRHAHVEIATHSAHGKQYRVGRSALTGRKRGGVHGADAVRDDVRTAEAMLGLPGWPQERAWASAIRTEAWASNETEAQAWTGMSEAGIALVFDHNADPILPRPQWTAPSAWFERDVLERLFIPMFEKNVATANDHFRLPSELARRMASLGSPEPDPCCNDAVTFDMYAEYVMQWHKAFRRIGVVGGLTEVWLWHPSTPVVKGGFPEVKRILQDMVDDPGVAFFRANELATWYANREQVRVRPWYAGDGMLAGLELDVPVESVMLPLPPGSSPAAGTVSYWVLGEIELPGWESRLWTDEAGRTITVLSQKLPDSEIEF